MIGKPDQKLSEFLIAGSASGFYETGVHPVRRLCAEHTGFQRKGFPLKFVRNREERERLILESIKNKTIVLFL